MVTQNNSKIKPVSSREEAIEQLSAAIEDASSLRLMMSLLSSNTSKALKLAINDQHLRLDKEARQALTFLREDLDAEGVLKNVLSQVEGL